MQFFFWSHKEVLKSMYQTIFVFFPKANTFLTSLCESHVTVPRLFFNPHDQEIWPSGRSHVTSQDWAFSTFIMVLHIKSIMQMIKIVVKEGIKPTKRAFLRSFSKFMASSLLLCIYIPVLYLYIFFSYHNLNV